MVIISAPSIMSNPRPPHHGALEDRQHLGTKDLRSGLSVQDLGFRVHGLRFRAEAGLRAAGSEFPCSFWFYEFPRERYRQILLHRVSQPVRASHQDRLPYCQLHFQGPPLSNAHIGFQIHASTFAFNFCL